MIYDPHNLPEEALAFLSERHLATLAINRSDRSPQLTPVGVTFDPSEAMARVITWSDSVKARLVDIAPGTPVSICQVDGGRWLTLYGSAHLSNDSHDVDTAVVMYTERYRPPKQRSDRVVIMVSVDRIVGRVPTVS